MSEPVLRPVQDPAVWRADALGGKEGLVLRFDGSESAAIAELVDASSTHPVLEVTPQLFPNPALARFTERCRRELASGRGAVIISGLDHDQYDLEAFKRIYWYLGQLIGRPVVQSEKGDLLGLVRNEKTQTPRGYTSNMELGFHTDFHEILSLASVQTAFAGGESGLVSSLYIHNIMLEECPDLLRALYVGSYDALEAFWLQSPPSKKDLSAFLPYFSTSDGKLSFQTLFFSQLVKHGETIPPGLKEALTAAQAIANRPGVAARFLLQPYEMAFWNNFTVMHARTEFTDVPGQERLLLRLWLHAHQKRPAIFAQRAEAVDRLVSGLQMRAQQAEHA